MNYGRVLVCFLLVTTSWASAQVGLITWEVNMANEDVSPEGVYIAGGDYFGVPGDNPMSDADGDGIWSITMAMPLGYSGAYTFTNGACGDWTCKENIVNQPCAFGPYSDRELPEVTGDATYSTCFSQCSTDGSCITVTPVDVTFQVDMSDYSGSFNEVFVTGGFDGWCGSCIPMTDNDGTGVYSTTVSLESDMSYEYFYVVDGFQDMEQFSPGDPCTLTTDIYTNRLLETEDEDMVLPPVCWNSCFACPESDIPFYEDFANGFAGNNGVGAWTAEDTGGGLIWQAVDAAGDGYFADGTASGVHPPAGEFSTNIATLSSTTADNGWIIYDNDYWNTPTSEGYSDNEGWLTSPNLNFSTNASVIVSWEQYFRYCCYSFAPLFLQVSADDGASWTTFDAHGSFEEKANTMSANGMTVTVDISCVAAYESNVMIRFAWLQPEETGEGYSHYFWGIDDITISESLVSDDLVAKQITTGDVADGFDYSVIPLEQFEDAANGGILVGFMYKNIGEQNQLETEVLIEIVDETGAVINSTTEQIGTVVSQGNSDVCPVSEMDTVYISTGWAPTQTGEFLVRGTITSASVDATPSNNVLEHSFIVSEDEMGHDISDVDTELIPGPNDIEGLYDPTGYGHFFQMTNAGSNAYGLAVKFGPGSYSVSNTLQFMTRLYEMGSVDELNTAAFTETLWSYDDSWTPSAIESGEWIYLPFGTPVSLQEDAFYFASIITLDASEGVLSVVANADADVDKAARIFGRNDSGEFEWQMESNDIPLIRLVFSEIEFSGCTDELACNYEEGATTDDGTCEYESCAGCMDQEACNFNSAATIDNPMACEFPEPNYDCFGACIDTEACVFVYPGTPYIQYEQGFEGLYPGDPVSQLTSWTTWSGESGTAEDALVSNVIARSGVNSLHIYSNEINVSLNNTLLLTGFDSGVYDLSFWMYIPDNASSSYNIQEELVPGIGEAFEVEFDWTGSAFIFDSGEWTAEFSFPHDSWFKLTHIIDMDGNEIDFYVDNNHVVTRPFESNFGGVNFDSEGDGVQPHNCFVDDLEVSLVDGIPQACTYPGCQDPSASNYDASAGCEGECIYLTYDCASIGESAWGGELMGLFPDWQEAMHGVAWEGEWVFNVPATMIEPGSGVSYGVHHVDWLGMEGMPDWVTATSFDAGEAMGPSTQHCIAAYGTPTAPGMHTITATGEVFISIFGQPFSIGEQSFSATLEVMANPNPILGCTYPLANNYLSYATLDDGGCEYWGCTDADAANFNPFANVDDGSCGEACDPAGDSTCQADNDGDGVITVTDLLILLGEFGTECE